MPAGFDFDFHFERFDLAQQRGELLGHAPDSSIDRPEPAWYVYAMKTLAEIEMAVEALEKSQKQELVRFLLTRLQGSGENATIQAGLPSQRHSVLDIQPVRLGAVLRPLTADDDLLGEMLEDRL